MKVLVTGGCGFIGYHTVNELLAQGHDVVIFDRMSTGKMNNFIDIVQNHSVDGEGCRAELVRGDIAVDHVQLYNTMQGCDAIIHLAAVVSVVDSIEDPWKSFHSNTIGFMSVLDKARQLGIKKIVYASSAATYGNSDSSVEGRIVWNAPTSPYGADKLANDMYADVFKQLYGMNPIGFRYFNVYGPRQDPKSAYAGVIAKFLDWSKRNETFKIFGDGEQIRSFVYVGDIAKMNVLAATTDIITPNVYNIANPDNTYISLNGLIEVLEQITNRKIDREYLPGRAGEIKNSIADLTALNSISVLPDFTTLDVGLKTTLESL
jgi:UDP-glucose 4-epimerase